MNRNVEAHFSKLPKLDINRTTFDLSHSHKFSANVGELIPTLVQEVVPGDTFRIQTAQVVRLQTLITPMMDNLVMDTFYFFVPNRLVHEHFREIMGENTASAWIPQVTYAAPYITAPQSTGWAEGTIADYMGTVINTPGIEMLAYPFRSYALICNEFFRDENLTDPLVIPVSDSTVAGSNGSNYITDVAKGGKPFIVSKLHDYFTSALPAPQKGPDIQIPVAQNGPFPVVPTGDLAISGTNVTKYPGTYNTVIYNGSGSGKFWGGGVGVSDTLSGNTPNDPDFDNVVNKTAAETLGYFANLWAIDDGSAVAATINQLRMAFSIQKFYERSARSGSRYIETIKAHFGVSSSDARLQRPEYLGGHRYPLHINQVIQQSATSSGEYLGDVAAMSVSSDCHFDVDKSFEEHGYLIGLACVRIAGHSYQQGLDRHWSRRDMFDFYWPEFSHLGEQEILNKEIYAQGTNDDDEVFGYQERYAELRFAKNRVSGEMRSDATLSLDVWHLADDYSSLPYLSDGWIREDKSLVDRVLNVTSSVANQYWADFYFKIKATRPLPAFGVPGLIDHF